MRRAPFLGAARRRSSEGLFTEYVVDELDAGQTMVSVGPASIVNGMTPPSIALVMASFREERLTMHRGAAFCRASSAWFSSVTRARTWRMRDFRVSDFAWPQRSATDLLRLTPGAEGR